VTGHRYAEGEAVGTPMSYSAVYNRDRSRGALHSNGQPATGRIGVDGENQTVSIAPGEPELRYKLTAFRPRFAATIAAWPLNKDELRWLAPSTPPPLTAQKVKTWPRAGGLAFAYVARDSTTPVAYGEINPMRNQPDHYWLGHIVVSPDFRGHGIGRAFTIELTDHAFGPLCASRVSLVVFPDNEAAIRCYTSSGFRMTGTETHRFPRNAKPQRLLRFEMTRRAHERLMLDFVPRDRPDQLLSGSSRSSL